MPVGSLLRFEDPTSDDVTYGIVTSLLADVDGHDHQGAVVESPTCLVSFPYEGDSRVVRRDVAKIFVDHEHCAAVPLGQLDAWIQEQPRCRPELRKGGNYSWATDNLIELASGRKFVFTSQPNDVPRPRLILSLSLPPLISWVCFYISTSINGICICAW